MKIKKKKNALTLNMFCERLLVIITHTIDRSTVLNTSDKFHFNRDYFGLYSIR